MVANENDPEIETTTETGATGATVTETETGVTETVNAKESPETQGTNDEEATMTTEDVTMTVDETATQTTSAFLVEKRATTPVTAKWQGDQGMHVFNI